MIADGLRDMTKSLSSLKAEAIGDIHLRKTQTSPIRSPDRSFETYIIEADSSIKDHRVHEAVSLVSHFQHCSFSPLQSLLPLLSGHLSHSAYITDSFPLVAL